MENNKTTLSVIVGIIVLILIGLGIYSFIHKGGSVGGINPSPSSQVSAGENSIEVQNQVPGNSVYVSSMTLANPGFVAVYADDLGKPGKFLGSAYFPTGTQPGIVALTENMLNGSTYWTVLFADNGDKVFDQAKDTVLKDASGNILMKSFKADNNVPEQKG